MTGPDRGRNADSIETVVSNMRRIIIAVGAKDDLALVFYENTSNLRNNYLMKYCVDRKTKPSSVRKYLYSFIDFCYFLITNKVRDITKLSGYQCSNVKTRLEQSNYYLASGRFPLQNAIYDNKQSTDVTSSYKENNGKMPGTKVLKKNKKTQVTT